MGCQKIACSALSSGFLAQARIGTTSKAGVYTFGNFPAGIYQVTYSAGAVFNIVFGWNAFSDDSQNVVVIACDGGLHMLLPGTGTKPTQALAEAAANGTTICFEHSGGSIGIEFSSAIYDQNIDGKPNPTFNLFGVVPLVATDVSNNSDNAGGRGVPILGCAEKVDCPEALTSSSPIQNFSSEAPDVPSNPFFPVIPAIPVSSLPNPDDPFPPPDAPPPPTPPPLNNTSYNCVIDPILGRQCIAVAGGGTFATWDECLANCSGTIPPNTPNPPPNPPPPPPAPVTYDCVDGACIDPGDGSGAYGDAQSCGVACSGSPCGVITPDGPVLGTISFPIDCSCSVAVTFTMVGGSFPEPGAGESGMAYYVLQFGGIGYQLTWTNTSTLVMASDIACGLALTILGSLGQGTYDGCIQLSNIATPQPCCPVSFDVFDCKAFIWESISPNTFDLSGFDEIQVFGQRFTSRINGLRFDDGFGHISTLSITLTSSIQFDTDNFSSPFPVVGVYTLFYTVDGGATWLTTGLTVTVS